MNYKEIGKQIKRKRIENKLRQEDLAEMADLSTGYISQVECGKKAPSLENFIIIFLPVKSITGTSYGCPHILKK